MNEEFRDTIIRLHWDQPWVCAGCGAELGMSDSTSVVARQAWTPAHECSPGGVS